MPVKPAATTSRRKKRPPSFDVARPAADAVRAERTGWVYRSEPAAARAAAPPDAAAARVTSDLPAPSEAAAGLLSIGLEMLTLPFAAAVIVALAPVQWLFSRRSRR